MTLELKNPFPAKSPPTRPVSTKAVWSPQDMHDIASRVESGDLSKSEGVLQLKEMADQYLPSSIPPYIMTHTDYAGGEPVFAVMDIRRGEVKVGKVDSFDKMYHLLEHLFDLIVEYQVGKN